MNRSAFVAKIAALTEGVGIALDSIRANKVRAGLTILGIAVGVAAGVYPASRASRLDPIVALRAE